MLSSNNYKAKPAERRGRKATGLRFLREAMDDSPKDPWEDNNMKTFVAAHPNRKRYTLALAGVLLLIALPTWAVTPVEVAKLLAADGAQGDEFGFSVSVFGDTAVIGAFSDDNTARNSGSVYVFIRSGTTWSQRPSSPPLMLRQMTTSVVQWGSSATPP